ncbi:MAG: ComEA family DNA-binding protein [Chloroflexi bacterium]|nr:ComEA family DNA-binding protein [Chloroflexota bacterium]
MEDQADRHRGLLTVLLLIVVAAGAVVWLLRRPETRPLEMVSPPLPAKSPERTLKVYVHGEVLHPGVYTLQEGDRVEDALAAAGGVTEQADRTRINLAARVRDQQQLNVPPISVAKEPAVPGLEKDRDQAPSASVPSATVNLNTASAVELDALPGIGPVTVQKILGHREQIGPFTSIEELKDAKLVNKAQFERIKDRISAP